MRSGPTCFPRLHRIVHTPEAIRFKGSRYRLKHTPPSPSPIFHPRNGSLFTSADTFRRAAITPVARITL